MIENILTSLSLFKTHFLLLSIRVSINFQSLSVAKNSNKKANSMESHLMVVKAREYYYNKLCCNKYVSSTTQLNELNEYFRNYLENIPIRIIITWINAQAHPAKSYLILDFTMILQLAILPLCTVSSLLSSYISI